MKLSKRIIIVLIAALSVAASVAAAIWYTNSVNQEPVQQAVSTADQPPAPKPKAADTKDNRVADAGKFMAAIADFQVKNRGGMPISYIDNQLSAPDATSVKYELSFFDGVEVVRTTQDPIAVDSKTMRMVLQAKCGQDGATIEVPEGIVSLQYSDGDKAQCISSR